MAHVPEIPMMTHEQHAAVADLLKALKEIPDLSHAWEPDVFVIEERFIAVAVTDLDGVSLRAYTLDLDKFVDCWRRARASFARSPGFVEIFCGEDTIDPDLFFYHLADCGYMECAI